MEPISIAAVAAVAMRYVIPAIRELGAQVLEKSTDAAGDSVVGFGRRVLQLLLSGRTRGDQPVLEAALVRRVVAVAENPGQQKGSDQLEGVIEDLLAADPALLKAVSGLLDRAPTEVGATDKSVHIGRDSSGPVVTGDGNVVFGR
jgi:hypothetical protein